MLQGIIEVIICVFIADFITGFFHWVEDTYGVPSWPVIGKLVIIDNINHHKKPSMASFMGSLIRRLGPTIYIILVVFFIAMMFDIFTWHVTLVGFLGFMGNEVHNWNHDICRHWSIDLLRNYGIIQSKKHHARHHVPPYDRAFCTLTNYLNPVLDKLRFWRAMEWSLSLVGIQPKRLSPERDGY